MPAGTSQSRNIRIPQHEDESESSVLGTPFSDSDIELGHEEDRRLLNDEECGADREVLSPILPTFRHHNDSPPDTPFRLRKPTALAWTRRRRIPSLRRLFCGLRERSKGSRDKTSCRNCRRKEAPLRRILRCLAFALMLLGLLEFVLLVIGLVASFFPSDVDEAYIRWRSQRPHDPTSHWPTDYTADIQPVHCHSHNDYWRPVPLKSAIEAGCTGVEADVWLFPDQSTDELYVGHSRSSLTPQRTFRSLYIDPIVEILERQNPNTTLHPTLDSPRNGVFDTSPEQSLILLVDFKTDGQELWSYVSEQLQPLRQRKYLTHFNGTEVVEGPVTVVATGNAPFNKVVENAHYRDIFFDAPLELLGNLAPSLDSSDDDTESNIVKWSRFDDVEEKNYLSRFVAKAGSANASDVDGKVQSNQGQGHSGAAPKNPAIYTPANSFYASVSFASTIGHSLPFLTRNQRHRIRQQIAGAHKQGLKVRYWNTPGWPVGLRNYIWRVLVEEGVDYLNVDDLQAATRGDWGRPRLHRGWGLQDWSLWSRI